MAAQRLGIAALFILCIFCGACSSTSQTSVNRDQRIYLQNNIHAQTQHRDTKASYANWTDPGAGHIVIPVNSPVTFGRFRRGFLLKNLADGRDIYFEYNANNMGMSVQQYQNLIASPRKVNLEDFSDMDLKGIKQGKVLVGMTKQGVRIALGYPAAHRTPSLESDTWIYWRNRRRTMAVEFGNDGIVKHIRY